MVAEVLNSSSVLTLNFCTKLNICASISTTSPSCKTLAKTPKGQCYEQTDDGKIERLGEIQPLF